MTEIVTRARRHKKILSDGRRGVCNRLSPTSFPLLTSEKTLTPTLISDWWEVVDSVRGTGEPLQP